MEIKATFRPSQMYIEVHKLSPKLYTKVHKLKRNQLHTNLCTKWFCKKCTLNFQKSQAGRYVAPSLSNPICTTKHHCASTHLHGESVNSVKPSLLAFNCQLFLKIFTMILLRKYGICDCANLRGSLCTQWAVKVIANTPQSLQLSWRGMSVLSSHDHRNELFQPKWLYLLFNHPICIEQTKWVVSNGSFMKVNIQKCKAHLAHSWLHEIRLGSL